jgi:type IX secretion system PorP/SprF family membrane protein
MKKQNLLILAIILFSINNAFAQQLPNLTYFMYDHARTNPGSLGSKEMVCASFIHKNSLVGFEGAPNTTFANLEVPFNLFGAKHGAGLLFDKDALGLYSNINLKIGYAFRFNVADGTLGLGINGKMKQSTLNASEFRLSGQENAPTDDPNIPQGNQENLKSFGAGIGLFYRSEDIYLGASVSNIYSSELIYESSSTGSNASEVIKPHYYVTAGYNFQLSNPAYEIEPAILLYSDGVSTTFDLNAMLTYNKKIWGGVTYRAGSAVSGQVGLMILDGLKVGYAYDYNTSALSKHASGAHELLINYCFKIGVEKSPQRYRSIRYL